MATNRGELEFIKPIVSGLLELTNTDDPQSLVTELHRQESNPRKKRLVIIPSYAAPEVNDDDLPSFRPIQESDQGLVLDAIGDHLRNDLHLATGDIPSGQRTAVLRNVVTFLYGQLQHLVATLNSAQLLEWLLNQHEAIMAKRALLRVTVPSRLACFGETNEIRDEMRAETKANVASRFLIEYVAAQPPHGLRPISLSVYDRLLVLAYLVFDFGTESDLIHFDLADIQLRMLPSGRLGANRDQFEPRKRAYAQSLAGNQITLAQSEFSRMWDSPTATYDPSQEMIDLDQAAIAEFGLSITAISEFLIHAALVGSEEVTPPAFEQEVFRKVMTQRLNWPPHQINDALNLLSLSPRQNFLQPPAPHTPRDVEPWNFNRSLSFIRRPFVHRGSQIIFGYRHVLSAREYFLDLCISGRLRASSESMKIFIGRMHKQRGKAFEVAVANRLKRIPDVKVLRGIEKIRYGENTFRSPGDIDVLAINTRRRTLWIIECKDLATSRTPNEFAQELRSLVKGQFPQKSTTEKHSLRAEWVRKNVKAVMFQFGITDVRQWRLRPAIVIDTELITPYLTKTSIPILTVEELLRRI